MKRFAIVDKKIGETPLMAIQSWKKQFAEYRDMPACYAGRLDPMASGKLLILLGEECKRQRAYTALDKEYEIEVLLDLGSDTGDALGIPAYAHRETLVDKKTIVNALRRECGAHLRAYPAFSSKTVSGKPLFLHALEETIRDIEIPEHIERIYHIQNLGSRTISHQALENRVSEFLDRVPRTNEPSKQLGDNFRVDTIRAHWESIFETARERDFVVLRLSVICASGTYMRSLAGRIGDSLHTRALALSIKRTKIGRYIQISNNIGFWTRTY